MKNFHPWIIMLLVWNLGLLIAGGVMLYNFWQQTPVQNVVAATCAAEVKTAIGAIKIE